jgi:hypothetical protein
MYINILTLALVLGLSFCVFGFVVLLIINYAYEKARFKVINNSVVVLPVWWGKYFRILGYK